MARLFSVFYLFSENTRRNRDTQTSQMSHDTDKQTSFCGCINRVSNTSRSSSAYNCKRINIEHLRVPFNLEMVKLCRYRFNSSGTKTITTSFSPNKRYTMYCVRGCDGGSFKNDLSNRYLHDGVFVLSLLYSPLCSVYFMLIL
jgi:hypothetical protein